MHARQMLAATSDGAYHSESMVDDDKALLRNAQPIIADTSAPLADFLDRMAAINASGLIECRSRQHVTELTHPSWRKRLPDENGGYHADISNVCSLCYETRKAAMARWSTDPKITALVGDLLHWLLAREWGTAGRCDSCGVPRDGQKLKDWQVITADGHEMMCGASKLLVKAGFATRASRDEARAELGESPT